MAFIPVYILILGFTIVVDYFAGIWLENTEGGRKKYFLIASLIANIGVLAVFKYYNFLNDNLSAILNSFGYHNTIPYLSILLPIGLSFHTFQAMSYTIEVYRGHQKAERNFGIYALYVMFYPQLVAGPIERPQNLLHQFYDKHTFEYERVVDGLKQMLWGLFKKIVIADRLSIYVTAVYNNQENHTGATLLVATFFFTFQVYCDFSGYSDVAIGAAKVMGIKLIDNFRRPFLAQSVSELWQRWHISLTSWFKDYLYIPLGGNRVKRWRWYLNISIVFLLSGLWHGAAWTYVLFGAIQCILLITPLVFKKVWNFFPNTTLAKTYPTFYQVINILLAFSLFSFSLFVFRALSINDAYEIFLKFLHLKGPIYIGELSTFLYGIFFIVFLIIIEIQEEYTIFNFSFFRNQYSLVRHFSYAFVVILILLFGVFDGGQFIYFQF